jgi:hypothetical protein
LQVEVSLRERFSCAAQANNPAMDGLLGNNPGIVELRKSMLRRSKADLLDEDTPDDLLPALHGPKGLCSQRDSAERISLERLKKDKILTCLDAETPRTHLQRIGEKVEGSSMNTASKAGEALLRHLYGGASVHDNNLFTTELAPPPEPICSGLQQRSKKETSHSHFTEGLLGWQSGALDLQPSSTTQRLSEEVICTRMELVMHRNTEQGCV